MEVVLSFIVAVMAGVACHYIIKWLDGNVQAVTNLSYSTVKRKKRTLELQLQGSHFVPAWTCSIFLPRCIIAYAIRYFKYSLFQNYIFNKELNKKL